MENSNVVQNDTPYEPDQAEVDSNLYFDVFLEDVYCETPAGIFGLGVYAELRNIASAVADSCYGVENSYSVKWIGVAITEQILHERHHGRFAFAMDVVVDAAVVAQVLCRHVRLVELKVRAALNGDHVWLQRLRDLQILA